jgi:dienelactone hydrolase
MRALAALLAILSLLAPPAQAKVVGREVTYSADGVTFKGYYAHDEAQSGRRPGVLVVHEWWGHNDYARQRAEQLAALGYTALAVDMYGDGKTAEHPEDAGKFAGMVMSNLDGARARFAAARAFLEGQPETDGTRIAAIGYCFGGAVVLNMARLGEDLRGVASFHGSLNTPRPAEKGKLKAAILVCHGEADDFIPPDVVAKFKAEMSAAGADLRFKGYPGAKHGFSNPAADEKGAKFNLPLKYDAAVDAASWKELQSFLKEVFAR